MSFYRTKPLKAPSDVDNQIYPYQLEVPFKRTKSSRTSKTPPPSSPLQERKNRFLVSKSIKRLVRKSSSSLMGFGSNTSLSSDNSETEEEDNFQNSSFLSHFNPKNDLLRTPERCFSSNLSSPITPSSQNSRKRLFLEDILDSEKEDLDSEYSEDSFYETENCTRSGPSIFEIPEILHKVIEYIEIQAVLPKESFPIRRKGVKNEQEGDIINKSTSKPGSLHSCLLVNRLFNRITSELINKRVFFNDESKFEQYSRNVIKNARTQRPIKPNVFMLHKLYKLKEMSHLTAQISPINLSWVEFHMCPKILPPVQFLSTNLKKLIIPGSKCVDDNYLITISERCPNLEELDIRACELVTDIGLYNIARRCRKLANLNVGRHSRGELVTDASICLLAQNGCLKTLGVAGCSITDRSIWEVSVNCGATIERLSLNNCMLLTDQSIPLVLQMNYLPYLSVLEIRFLKLTNVKAIIEFRKSQRSKGISLLLETCDDLEARMKEKQLEMDREISNLIFNDILEWANDPDDGDIEWRSIL